PTRCRSVVRQLAFEIRSNFKCYGDVTCNLLGSYIITTFNPSTIKGSKSGAFFSIRVRPRLIPWIRRSFKLGSPRFTVGTPLPTAPTVVDLCPSTVLPVAIRILNGSSGIIRRDIYLHINRRASVGHIRLKVWHIVIVY